MRILENGEYLLAMKLSSVVTELAWTSSSGILFFNTEVSVELILAAKWHHIISF